MFKVIFFNKDFNFIKSTFNNVFSNFYNLQLIGIASTEKELKLLFENSEANMIVINNKDINNKISEIIGEFKVKLILCDDLKNTNNNKYTLYIPTDLESIDIKKNLTDFFSKIDETIIHKKVYNILKDLHFNFKLTGTKYLLSSIVYSYINKEDCIADNLEKNVYPYVAKQFNVSTSTIKWSIIRSINNIYSYPEYVSKYTTSTNKVTSKALIASILNQLN